MERFEIDINVRYAETDQMGFVYYSNYLVWFEMARTGYFKDKGLDYALLEEDRKIYLPVTEVACRYKRPVKYSDSVKVTVVSLKAEKVRLTFEYEVKVLDKVVATGNTQHVFIDENRKPIQIPPDVREMIIS